MKTCTPKRTRLPAPGDIYWVDEHAVAEQSRAHPHVVLGYDHAAGTVDVCALSTRAQRASEPGNVRLAPGEANLPRDSVVIVSRRATIDAHRLGAFIGTLSPPRVAAIVAGIGFQQRLIAERR